MSKKRLLPAAIAAILAIGLLAWCVLPTALLAVAAAPSCSGSEIPRDGARLIGGYTLLPSVSVEARPYFRGPEGLKRPYPKVGSYSAIEAILVSPDGHRIRFEKKMWILIPRGVSELIDVFAGTEPYFEGLPLDGTGKAIDLCRNPLTGEVLYFYR